jgi:hypothetical protein
MDTMTIYRISRVGLASRRPGFRDGRARGRRGNGRRSSGRSELLDGWIAGHAAGEQSPFRWRASGILRSRRCRRSYWVSWRTRSDEPDPGIKEQPKDELYRFLERFQIESWFPEYPRHPDAHSPGWR